MFVCPEEESMSLERIIIAFAAVAIVGCESKTDSSGPTVALALNSIPTLPPSWSNTPQQGIDSRVGFFSSTKHQIQIHYDIGELAGEYASTKPYPNYKWIKSGTLHGSSFRYLLNEDDTLYVTFPDEGPANFWGKVKDDAEIDYILELLARYRRELLAK
jgi:hypothetical protein